MLSKTEDKNEEDKIFIQYYKTDYYTHKVMHSIYQELRKEGHAIAQFSRAEDIKWSKYYPFLTSFGVASLLCIDNGEGNRALFLAKRSKFMANMNNADMWHVSMNEGLSVTDMDPNNPEQVSLQRCVERGYFEEVGIKSENRLEEIEFCDLFFVRENFEMGITAFATVKMSCEDLVNYHKGAEDASMETVDKKVIPYTKNEIKKFRKENKLTDIAEYALAMRWCRM